MLIAFAIAGLLLATLIAAPVWQSMTGKELTEMTAYAKDPAYGRVFQVIHVINQVVGYFLSACLVAFLLHRRPAYLLGFHGSIRARQAGLVILITAIALLVGTALSYINHQVPIPADWKLRFDKMETDYNQQAQAILNLKNTGDYIIALLVMAVVPAICEETLFRGGLQNFLTRSARNYWVGVVVVSLLFSVAHFSFYGFLFRFFLGMVLGLIYQYTGRLWLAILAHFLNNALAVTVYYMYLRQGKSVDEAMNMTAESWWTILFLPILIILFMLLRRASVKPA
ncbi:MAG TPA: CPBP family intramembrane metalloprotease [Chitinophagaceae bacterium]|nr:CPBP family intramembrane metalloprotease [Chitinophagaceae bacterium]